MEASSSWSLARTLVTSLTAVHLQRVSAALGTAAFIPAQDHPQRVPYVTTHASGHVMMNVMMEVRILKTNTALTEQIVMIVVGGHLCQNQNLYLQVTFATIPAIGEMMTNVTMGVRIPMTNIASMERIVTIVGPGNLCQQQQLRQQVTCVGTPASIQVTVNVMMEVQILMIVIVCMEQIAMIVVRGRHLLLPGRSCRCQWVSYALF